jgi:hypothetical protein
VARPRARARPRRSPGWVAREHSQVDRLRVRGRRHNAIAATANTSPTSSTLNFRHSIASWARKRTVLPQRQISIQADPLWGLLTPSASAVHSGKYRRDPPAAQPASFERRGHPVVAATLVRVPCTVTFRPFATTVTLVLSIAPSAAAQDPDAGCSPERARFPPSTGRAHLRSRRGELVLRGIFEGFFRTTPLLHQTGAS